MLLEWALSVTESDNLELKKRSRRRLVGAAALTLIAAIILPMVMDGEPGVPTQDIQVTIPDRDADSRLARPIVGRTVVSPEPETAPAPFEQAPTELPALPDEEASTPAVATVKEQSPPPASRPAPDVANPGETPAREPAGQPAPRPVVVDEAARVKAILEGRSSAEAARGQSFVIQVGAFGEAGKAASLSADLKSRGFNAFTEDAGAVTRVRIGPFASRGEADKTAERLAALGLNGVVTAR